MSEVIDIETPVIISRFRYYTNRARLMLKALFAVEPVIPNIIALILSAVVLCILDCKNFIPNIGKYHGYLYHTIQLLACYQVIISAKKSLIIPLGTTLLSVLGIIICHYMGNFSIALNILKEMVLLGVIGMMVSIFYLR